MTERHGYFRNGNRNARNVYYVNPDGSDFHVGCMFSERDGRAMVRAANAWLAWEREAGREYVPGQ